MIRRSTHINWKYFSLAQWEWAWKDLRVVQEWSRIRQVLPQVKGALEKGQTLFQEDLARAKGNQKYLEYFSIIDFVVDCYAYVSASLTFLDNPALWNWAINGYMLLWRQHFITEDLDLAE